MKQPAGVRCPATGFPARKAAIPGVIGRGFRHTAPGKGAGRSVDAKHLIISGFTPGLLQTHAEDPGKIVRGPCALSGHRFTVGLGSSHSAGSRQQCVKLLAH